MNVRRHQRSRNCVRASESPLVEEEEEEEEVQEDLSKLTGWGNTGLTWVERDMLFIGTQFCNLHTSVRE